MAVKGCETQRAAGFPNLMKGRETSLGTRAPEMRAKSLEVRQTKSLAKKQALLNLPEVRYFLNYADITHFLNI